MRFKGNVIENKLRDRIMELEEEYGTEISTTQKILLCEHGPLTTLLDVLYGEVYLFILDQHLEEADEEIAELLQIDAGDEIDYREVIVHKNGRPLVYTLSYIPTSRCSEEIFEDLMNERLTTGRIIDKNVIETFITIKNISIEKPSPTLKELFKTDECMLCREYIITHNKEIGIWTKEAYPLSYFKV
ncbi:chorismate pyruvate-lyase family protein [uncultured Methanobrevibacter sp.]|uniref:chorismate--pyruvate lyase family protein n=1 Tax=uncultured Methanobrevibacter sp. TaxID=253161 RepID=UPI0025D486E2|nr:chorismate pyruvate-lyase family protein [uncultured Methanobrevibacter sp.]